MNTRSILPTLLIITIATCAACDRRKSTGTSDVSREGQGDRPETAQDVRETAIPTPTAEPDTGTPAVNPSPDAPAAPPVGNAPQVQDATAEDKESDTLERP